MEISKMSLKDSTKTYLTSFSLHGFNDTQLYVISNLNDDFRKLSQYNELRCPLSKSAQSFNKNVSAKDSRILILCGVSYRRRPDMVIQNEYVKIESGINTFHFNSKQNGNYSKQTHTRFTISRHILILWFEEDLTQWARDAIITSSQRQHGVADVVLT